MLKRFRIKTGPNIAARLAECGIGEPHSESLQGFVFVEDTERVAQYGNHGDGYYCGSRHLATDYWVPLDVLEELSLKARIRGTPDALALLDSAGIGRESASELIGAVVEIIGTAHYSHIRDHTENVRGFDVRAADGGEWWIPEPAFEIATPKPLPEGKKCLIADALTEGIIKMLQAAPENPIVRTQAHAALLVPIPDEHKTFDAIKDWVEANVEPRVSPMRDEAIAVEIPTPHHPPAEPAALTIMVNVTERESGTCDYSVTCHGSAEYDISPAELRCIIDAAVQDGAGIDDLLERIISTAQDMAMEDRPETEADWDTEETDNHEFGDSHFINAHAQLSGTARERVLSTIQRLYPDEYRRLQEN